MSYRQRLIVAMSATVPTLIALVFGGGALVATGTLPWGGVVPAIIVALFVQAFIVFSRLGRPAKG